MGDYRCVVDVENPGQHGLTMRSIEIIGLKRKFITTNPDIVNYDFYNSNNMIWSPKVVNSRLSD